MTMPHLVVFEPSSVTLPTAFQLTCSAIEAAKLHFVGGYYGFIFTEEGLELTGFERSAADSRPTANNIDKYQEIAIPCRANYQDVLSHLSRLRNDETESSQVWLNLEFDPLADERSAPWLFRLVAQLFRLHDVRIAALDEDRLDPLQRHGIVDLAY